MAGVKSCVLCGEKKKPEDFKLIPYFLQEDPERKKSWCKICQSVWLRKKKEMKEPVGMGFVHIEKRPITVSFT